ncbi:MAG: CPBP family intramembrane metalloprotease domain-containing protein [Chloroflexi bacterium HGW-Chloroflexi-10]|nr:MAG: CPBP family intramembrane metalloprotease domain-containing protein [Chloroflexi bacterium HGW-Chloroflexi-10]
MNPFYNAVQHRMRALWRFLLQALFYLIIPQLVGIVFGLIAFAWMAISGTLPVESMLSPQAMTDALMSFGGGIFFLVNGLGVTLAAVAGFWIAGRWIDRRKFSDFGFHFSKQWWRDMGFGLLLGAGLMLMIFLIEYLAGWVRIEGYLVNRSTVSFAGAILISLIGFLFVGIYEEMISRGYMLRNLAEGFNWKALGARGGLWIGYVLSSSVFGLLHAGNPNATLVSTLSLVLAGFFLGLGFVLTGELAIPIGLHITWNFFQGNVFGFPVSGTTTSGTFIGIQQGGPELLTGGAFGPEAGLIGIFALLVGAGLTCWYVKVTRGAIKLRYDLAVYTRPTDKQVVIEPDAAKLVQAESTTSSLE